MFSIIRSSSISTRLFQQTAATASSRLFLRARARAFSTNELSHKINTESIVHKYSAGPITVRYTREHEWIAQHPDGVAFVGITKYASDALGDATYVELPEVDNEVACGDSFGSVESVKSSSEIYSPVDATVIEVNETLNDTPQLINEDPLGSGWLAKLKVSSEISSIDALLTEEQYAESLKSEE